MKKADTSLQIKKFINAPKEKIFNAWTHPEQIKRWFAPGNMTVPFAEGEAVIGGHYKIQMKNDKNEIFTTYGQYKEIIPNQKLVFTWGWEGPDRHETLVTLELTERDGGTELTLTHERFIDAAQKNHHAEGWEGCLANLADRINTF